jgi:hypothetical protein
MRTIFAVLGALVLAACGGGGDDSGPPPRVDVYVKDAVDRLYNPRTTIPVKGVVNGVTVSALLTFTDAPGPNSTWWRFNQPSATRYYGSEFVVSGPGGVQTQRTTLVQHFRIPDALYLGYIGPNGQRVEVSLSPGSAPLLAPVPDDGSSLSGVYALESVYTSNNSFPSERYRQVWTLARADATQAWVCLRTLNEFAQNALVSEVCGLTTGAGPFRQWRFVIQLPGFGPVTFTSA